MKYDCKNVNFMVDLTKVLEKVLEIDPQMQEAFSTMELVEEAHEQVRVFRAEIRRYDADRKHAPKPCKNYRLIADRIVEQLENRYMCRNVPRAYAYKVLFIMYLICKVELPLHCSWWEQKFLEGLHIYLESTDYFKGTSCRTQWAIILDQLPGQGRLPLDVVPIVPAEQPPLPIIGPTTVFYKCWITVDQTNNGCQQFYGTVNNPKFQEVI